MGELNSCLTIAGVLDWYLAHEVRDFSPVALKERRRVWQLFRMEYGQLKVQDARPLHLLEFLAANPGIHSNHTRRRFRATICRPFNLAAEVGLVARNPFAGLKIPDGAQGRDWTDDEFRALLRVAAPYMRRLIVFLRFSGARPGEARGLQWPQIRHDLAAIVQAEHKTRKTKKGPRTIYFNSVLVKLLAWLWRNRSSSSYVFVNRRGRPWTIRALSNHVAILRDRAQLPPDVRAHGARHTFATHAIMNGIDLATVAELLGHASTKTTERYTHLASKHAHLNAASESAIRGSRAR